MFGERPHWKIQNGIFRLLYTGVTLLVEQKAVLGSATPSPQPQAPVSLTEGAALIALGIRRFLFAPVFRIHWWYFPVS